MGKPASAANKAGESYSPIPPGRGYQPELGGGKLSGNRTGRGLYQSSIDDRFGEIQLGKEVEDLVSGGYPVAALYFLENLGNIGDYGKVGDSDKIRDRAIFYALIAFGLEDKAKRLGYNTDSEHYQRSIKPMIDYCLSAAGKYSPKKGEEAPNYGQKRQY